MIRLRQKEFTDIVEYMRDNYGINLDKKKVLIECRMTKDLERRGLSSFEEYLKLLKKDSTGTIAGEMVNRLTTNYTYFMREPAHFNLLKEQIFPELFGRSGYKVCKIWSAGCSTGEECYTLAMLLEDWKDKKGWLPLIRITATDISAEALEHARKAEYVLKEMESIPAPWQTKYCRIIDEKRFALDEKLKAHIQFQRKNLLEPGVSADKYDVIMCRNVMIYFDRATRVKLIRRLEDSLNAGGYLLIGHAELLSREETRLETVYPAIYRKK